MKVFSLLGSRYFPEFSLIFILFEIMFYILTGFNRDFIIVSGVTFMLLSILLSILTERRERAVKKIKAVIKGINRNEFSSPEEIVLEGSLHDLELEIRKMYNKMRSDIEYLKKLEKIRTEFLANVSHELRTPIFTIQGYLETLLNGAMDDPSVNTMFLKKAIRHTGNLSNLLNDLIDISMIESGQMKMTFVHFKVDEFMQNIIKEFAPLAASKGLELRDNTIREGLQLYADKPKLKQVLGNLIQNAIKYTERGKIELIVEEEEKSAKIIVRDSGIGISTEDTQRIFERFYRVDKTRSREIGGTGLGLAIVKHIVEAHGSKIEVNSEINKGTEFSFRLRK